MNKSILAMELLATTLVISPAAQSSDALVGTWKLVSYTSTTAKGEIKHFMGEKPLGFITYTSDGRMSVIITAQDRKPYSVNDPIAAPAEERAEACATMIAYAGRYTPLSGDQVTHHVEAASVPNREGTDLVRTVKIEGERLILRTPPGLTGGAQVTTEVVWERMR
jgi:hypothetical protein